MTASPPSPQVAEVVIHDDFVYPVLTNSFPEYDIALLRLRHSVQLTSAANLACLPPNTTEPPPGTLCSVTGWGHLRFGGGWSPDCLHRALLPLVSQRSAATYGGQRSMTA